MDKRTKLYKQLKASALICPCERIKERDLDDWLYAQAAAYGAHFTRDALAAISEYIEPVKEEIPLDLLQQEIGKLAIYASGRREWTEDDVLNVFALLPNASSFALTNYIMAGKLKQCLELLASERKHGTYILPLSATVAFKIASGAALSGAEAQRLRPEGYYGGAGDAQPICLQIFGARQQAL